MGQLYREELAALRRELLHAAAAEHRLAQMLDEQERQAERWRGRAELAERRGDSQLARLALERSLEHRRRADRLREWFHSEGARIKMLKRRLRDLEVGRGPPPAFVLPLEDPLEERFRILQQEEQLERDLAELKARIGGPQQTTS